MMSALLASAWRVWWVDGAILGHSRRQARWYGTVRTDKCPARCARASCSAGAERVTVWAKACELALFGQAVAAQLPQAERQRLESKHKLDLHRHKADCTVDHNCSSLHPELWRDRGATALVPCQALCVDANGKTYLASPSGGAERGDLIDAVVGRGSDAVLCSSSHSLLPCPLTGRLPCSSVWSPRPQGALADIDAQASWLSDGSRTRGARGAAETRPKKDPARTSIHPITQSN